MGIFSNISNRVKSIFQPKPTITQTPKPAPNVGSIKVIDTSTPGTGQTITTSPSGSVTSTAQTNAPKTTSGGSGGGSSGGSGSNKIIEASQQFAQKQTGGSNKVIESSATFAKDINKGTVKSRAVSSSPGISNIASQQVSGVRQEQIQVQRQTLLPSSTSFQKPTGTTKSFSTLAGGFITTSSRQLKDVFQSGEGSTRGGFELSKTIFLQPFSIVKGGVTKTSKAVKGLEGGKGSIKIINTDRDKPIFEKTNLNLKGSKALGTIGGGSALLIPETPAESGLLFGGIKLFTITPKLIRGTASAGFGIVGTKGALDKSSSGEERVASGIVGGLGITGAASEFGPFIKGQAVKILPTFRGVKAETTKVGNKEFEIKAIKGVKSGEESFDIRLIPEGGGFKPSGIKPGEGAVIRGGFGFKPKEQIQAFGGKNLRLTTSQRGLKPTRGEFKTNPEVSELGFFFTPADPITKVPQTRASRLGLQNLFAIPKSAETTFKSSEGGKPLIIVTEPTKITTKGITGTKGTARISPKGSTELEVTAGTNIKVLSRGQFTTIGGQSVEIFRGTLSKQTTTSTPSKSKIGDIIGSTSGTKTFISPTATISSTTGTINLFGKTTKTPKVNQTTKLTRSTKGTSKIIPASSPPSFIPSSPISIKPSSKTFGGSSLPKPSTPPRTPPLSPPPRGTGIIPPISPPSRPPIVPPKRPPRSPPFLSSLFKGRGVSKQITSKSSPLNIKVGRSPTLDAIGLNIRGKSKSSAELIGAGPIVTRPILTQSKTKRRKK
jgi:hypothetical protein